MRVERMRGAILEGIPPDTLFAKPGLPLMQPPQYGAGPYYHPQPNMAFRPAGSSANMMGGMMSGPPIERTAGRGRGLLGRYPLHRENRENSPQKIPDRENTGIWKFCQNTGYLFCLSCKLPDSKSKRYFNICRKKFQFFLSCISLPSQFCVCNSHKSRKLAQGKFVVGQRKKEGNTGNLKMKFEWVACYMSGTNYLRLAQTKILS